MSTDTADVADDERATVEVEHAPARASSIAAVVAAVLAALTSGPFSVLALPLALGGAVIVGAGLFLREERSWVTFGTAGLLLSVVISGIAGASAELLLVSAAAAVLAWDFGQHAISLGEQLGRHTQTWRNEALHASASTLVAMLVVAFGYGTYSALGGARPVGAVAALAVGLVFLVWAIRT